MEGCDICQRIHGENDPCPMRIANAYTMQPQALEQLSGADKKWIASHPTFSVLRVLEEEVADICAAEIGIGYEELRW